MRVKNLVKIILFIFISTFLLISLSGCTMLELKTSSNPDILTIDTSYNSQLASINKILEKNAQYENIDSIIKNLEFDTVSYTLNIHCSLNNDKEIMAARNKRIAEIQRKFGNT